MAFVFNDLQLQETPNKNNSSSSLMSLIEKATFSTHRQCAFISWYSHPFIQMGFYLGTLYGANAGNFGLQLPTTLVTFLSKLKAGV